MAEPLPLPARQLQLLEVSSPVLKLGKHVGVTCIRGALKCAVAWSLHAMTLRSAILLESTRSWLQSTMRTQQCGAAHSLWKGGCLEPQGLERLGSLVPDSHTDIYLYISIYIYNYIYIYIYKYIIKIVRSLRRVEPKTRSELERACRLRPSGTTSAAPRRSPFTLGHSDVRPRYDMI